MLEAEQLTRVLTDLNDGHAPTSAEVQWVLHKADKADGVIRGGVSKTVFMVAISAWYACHNKDDSKCVIM